MQKTPELGNLFLTSTARTFSISPENKQGERGKGGMAASVAYWYQTEPHAPFPALPDEQGRTPR